MAMTAADVLKMAKENDWKNVLILEDDFTCRPGIDMNHMIQLLYNTAEFDVGLLTHNELIHSPTSHDHIKKVIQSMTASHILSNKNTFHYFYRI